MVSKIIKTIYILMTLTILASFALADFQTTTITWVVPAAVSHSLGYGASCTESLFYFTEHDATIDGTQKKILPQHGAAYAADTNCQNGSDTVAITLTNGGNITIDANMAITTTLQANVTLKVWAADGSHCGADGIGGWEDVCSNAGGNDAGIPTTSACVPIGDSNVQVVANLAAAGTAKLCFAADFADVAQGENTDTLESSAWQSEG